jgi:hypothetical protein
MGIGDDRWFRRGRRPSGTGTLERENAAGYRGALKRNVEVK